MTRFLFALLLAASAVSAHAETLHIYSNSRFGATALVPSNWKADPPPENGDGLIFRSPDGAASVTVSGSLNVSDSVAEAMQEQQSPNDGEAISYHQNGRRSVVVSGTNADHIFYRKSILVCRDQIWDSVDLEYPAVEKARYDALVGQVARSLRFSGESDQISDCK